MSLIFTTWPFTTPEPHTSRERASWTIGDIWSATVSVAHILGVLAVVLFGAIILIASRGARSRRWSSTGLSLATAVAVVILAVLVISDWPTGWLDRFWAEHSVLAAVVTTILLAIVAFLAFEARETAMDEELSEKVSTAGLSGLVDSLIDIDIAVLMVRQAKSVPEYTSEGRPLQWLTTQRRTLLAEAARGSGVRRDPTLTVALSEDDRADILSQCIRRLVAGMRDWASLVGSSADGRKALVKLGDVRIALLEAMRILRRDDADALDLHLGSLRRRLQLLALIFEVVASKDLALPGIRVADKSGDVSQVAAGDDVPKQLNEMNSRLGSLLELVEIGTSSRPRV